MKRTMKVVAVVAVVSAMLAGVTGCAKSSSGTGATGGGTPEAAVRAFLDSSTKHGTLTFVSGNSPDEQKVEYWFDGDTYRLTWYNADGSERLHMISPDGKKLYYCYVEDKVCTISYILPEMHQWIFNGPPGWDLGSGKQEGDLTVYTYSAKKLWNVEGASQRFYLEDLVIYANDTRIVKVVTRTNSHTPENEDDLVTSEYRFDEPQIGATIPADALKLPYDIGEKK